MFEIKLTQGYKCVVDKESFQVLNLHKWHVGVSRGIAYAVRRERCLDGKPRTSFMHHYITGYPLKSRIRMVVDHINGNSLDNRKENLRIVSQSENACNNSNQRLGLKSSKFVGVCYSKRDKKWLASIWLNNRNSFLGLFSKEEEAKKAYDEAKVLRGY